METVRQSLKPTDAALVFLWSRRHERKIFNRLYPRHASMLREYLHYLPQDSVLEKDAFQDTWKEFLKVCNSPQPPDIKDFKRWMLHVAKTKALLILRAEKHHHDPDPPPDQVEEIIHIAKDIHELMPSLDEAYVDYLSPEDILLLKEKTEHVRTLLLKLPGYLRRIGWMHYVEGRDVSEISALLKLPRKRVESYLVRIPQWIGNHVASEYLPFEVVQKPRKTHSEKIFSK